MSRRSSPRPIPAELRVRRGDLVTTRDRLPDADTEVGHRKVYLVLGLSRNPARVRACRWVHVLAGWGTTQSMDPAEFVPAPAAWSQTVAAQAWLTKNRMP